LSFCRTDERCQIAGQSRPVGALMIEERAHLLPLAEEGFDLAISLSHGSTGCAASECEPTCIRLRRCGRTVEVRLYSSCVEVWNEGRGFARHERCYEGHQQVLDLEDYLDVLQRKPGALIGSKPLAAGGNAGCGGRVMTAC
jgi:hypothetical protein